MPLSLPMDLHSHSEHSHDASTPVMQMCEAAARMGVSVYAITDHCDLSGFDPSFRDLEAAISRSVADTSAAKERFRDHFLLLTGIELGQPLEKPAKAEEILQSHAFDFVLGSLHNSPGRLDPYYFKHSEDDALLHEELEAYFSHMLDMIHWGGFDSAAHITYPFRYILGLRGKAYPFALWDAHLEAIVQALADKGLALELNTSGLVRHPAHTMPDARWIRRFRELGGEKLTLGADAHNPRNVGAGIEEGVRIAADAGFRYLCYFVQRQPQYISL